MLLGAPISEIKPLPAGGREDGYKKWVKVHQQMAD